MYSVHEVQCVYASINAMYMYARIYRRNTGLIHACESRSLPQFHAMLSHSKCQLCVTFWFWRNWHEGVWLGLTWHIWWEDLHGNTFPHRLDSKHRGSPPLMKRSGAGRETDDHLSRSYSHLMNEEGNWNIAMHYTCSWCSPQEKFKAWWEDTCMHEQSQRQPQRSLLNMKMKACWVLTCNLVLVWVATCTTGIISTMFVPTYKWCIDFGHGSGYRRWFHHHLSFPLPVLQGSLQLVA